ncbi:hypothetical protein PBI_CANTARE_23 [Brevibacterium phage Cantare]|uniref:Uncharacterized protein n=1 Tax=Brevibacterium phage Cantare TaxID=2338395 RepID=A0A3G3LZ00_9CAUD|nr:hypothetical protein PQD70_gp023 [Brevibacterium phage Cantare]AYQ99351.1 hypothetical protein PBI_CANTARE_23 [Brevibacterium phage Cantare]
MLNAQIDDWSIRLACHNVLSEIERKQEEKNKSKMK